LASSKEASASKSIVLIAFVLVIGALYFGRQIFIPLALALVFSFLLTPIVSLLEKIRFGRFPAVLTVLILGFVIAAGVTYGVATQLVQIIGELPDYKANLDTKIRLLRAPHSGNLSKATATVQELNNELAAVPGQISAAKQDKDQRTAHPVHPIPVQMAQPPTSFVQNLRELLGPLAGPIETGVIVIIFTLFMLVRREDLRNRAIRLAGHGQLNLMTQALDDAGRRLSKYLLMQGLVNVGYGAIFGLALYFIGVPHALLWAVCAAIFRFVPYVGTLIAAVLPITLTLAVFPGWHHAGWAFLTFVVLELTVANFVEPLLYGAHTGISSLAILVAAVFWATIWGPVGLILSTPLTVCLVVLGRYVPQLSFLEVVLGDEPVLLPEQCFYQRLLARDDEEARSLAEAHLKEHSLESLYETMILPALKLAEHDHETEGLDESTRRFMLRSVLNLIEDFGDAAAEPLESTQPQEEQDEDNQPRLKPTPAVKVNTACVAASSGADELVATMLAQLLQQEGVDSRVVRAGLPESLLPELSRGDYGIVCVSSISPFSVSEARTLCKTLRASGSGLRMVMGFWSLESNAAKQRLGAGCPGSVVATLSEALAQVRELSQPSVPASVAESADPKNFPASRSKALTI
jgi:predicted PurR-regulated permease PerM